MIGRHNGLVRATTTSFSRKHSGSSSEGHTDPADAGRQGQRIAELEQELAELRAAKAESDEKVMNYAAERANRVMSGLQ